jgi:DNA-binding Xre family transcriptional regulator
MTTKVKQISFSELLRKTILNSGKSCYQISAESGVDQGTLSRFMTGKRSIKLDTTEKLCHALGLTITKVAS